MSLMIFVTPLTSIKGYVEAMADGTIPPELYGKYLNIILCFLCSFPTFFDIMFYILHFSQDVVP